MTEVVRQPLRSQVRASESLLHGETAAHASDAGHSRHTIVTTDGASQFGSSYSSGYGNESFMASGAGLQQSGVFPGRATEMKLLALAPEPGLPAERPRDYKGRYRRWPGVVLLLAMIGVAAALITLGAVKTNDEAAKNQERFELATTNKRKIKDGLNNTDDLTDDDGQIGNPKAYPSMGCELPNYLSKNGQIVARSKNGTEVPVAIKGVNWFGMETGMLLPFGLWENAYNGTSAYEISSFLARNKFNSVRLPVCIKSILANKGPDKSLINMNTNRAMNISTYISTIKSLVKALAYRHSGGAWYSAELGVTEEQFLKAVDMLTSELCTPEYWNILGLDLKNEPHECSWGGAKPDWQEGATLIGNRMLKGCKNWMAFVEGINEEHTFTLNGAKKSYFDWWGGGLQNAEKDPVILSVADKVVYAPHYYNTGVTPAWYLYGGGTVGAMNVLNNYVELPDAQLKANVEATLEDMFGYLSLKKGYAVVMGEFAGLYAKDKHPMMTTKRTTDFTIEAMLDYGMAGGYMWSLNPESAYQYNPADKYGHYTEGLLEDDWLSPNKVFLEGMAKMDSFPNLRAFPCFPEEVASAMDTSQVTLSQAMRASEPALSLSSYPGPRADSAWRISALPTPNPLAAGRSSEPAFGTYYSNNAEPPSPKEPQMMRLIAKKAGDDAAQYRGQYRRWPGILLLLVVFGGAVMLITKNAIRTRDNSVARARLYELSAKDKRSIKDGKSNRDDITSDDGQIGNPKTYVSAGCEQPNYLSKNGQLIAVAANGTEVPFAIKGVNWFGMETSLAVPFGLWENQLNGTTAYEIASFLSRNNFNAVRLPLSVENLLKNTPPAEGVVNKQSNRALNLKNFTTTLQSIVQALEYRRIGVLLSMHTLTNTVPGGNWFDPSLGVSQDDFLKAVGVVSKELCGPQYWNVIGLDLKNEPHEATWGTGSDSDFVVGCEKIARVMHANCPHWLAFVEGVVGEHAITIDGAEMAYFDWWGGGLQKAGSTRPQFALANKLVWAPHYYTTAVSPQAYFYGPNTKADYSAYEELSDDALKRRVEVTMEHMFGYLVHERASAVVLGEFAGLYTKDAHPLQTTRRTTDKTIAVMLEKGYAGGFMWSLNPESKYEYNPANNPGRFVEGLLEDDWLTPNKAFVNAFAPMNSLPNLRPLPCFPVAAKEVKSGLSTEGVLVCKVRGMGHEGESAVAPDGQEDRMSDELSSTSNNDNQNRLLFALMGAQNQYTDVLGWVY
ncbi:hypothetical protein PybrP1_000904 [[Pythium] brassicae (nom. inval.)]|nr:hypothetical protein PybrP1_000904 [[Pythium] brassicae (nom. inval.)]